MPKLVRVSGSQRDNGVSPMTCGVCGRETSDAAATCTYCGSSLMRETVDPAAATTVSITAREWPTRHVASESPADAAYAPTLGPDAPTTTAGRSSGPRPAVTGPLAQGESFGPRYHIIRMLGIGGMGAVYQAWDEELGVAVAIKVIRPEAMKDPRTAAEVERRFKRELLLARQVTHKNVVRIHDIGEIEGIKYITMDYVKGTDLASRLRRDTRLPP